jgi:hypothetical protein
MKHLGLRWLERQIFSFHAGHLSITECGAAVSLAFHYGSHGELPETDAELAKIVGVSEEEFQRLAGDRSDRWGLMRTLKETILPLMYGEDAQ